MLDLLLQYCVNTWQVTGQMAPYLLLGFLVAGVLSAWVSPSWLERHLGGSGLGPVFTASLFGVPLPLCSCGVIPVGASLRRGGASPSATTAFLLSTPQTGVDSILVTWSMLGPLLAIFRPLTALLTGILGGVLVWLFGDRDVANDRAQAAASTDATCGSGDCCDGEAASATTDTAGRWRQTLHHGFVTLPRDIGTALIVGLLIAGAITTLIPEDALASYLGGGLLSILVLMLAGVPLYVCATASVPIAAGFIHLGVSPGAALAFLIAGPATNAATITTIWKILGRRQALLYLGTVAIAAFGCGALFDWLAPRALVAVPSLAEIPHEHSESGWAYSLAAVVLLGVLALSYRNRNSAAQSPSRLADEISDTAMVVLAVRGMNCGHCQSSVEKALRESAGVTDVEVDLEHGSATVYGASLDSDALVLAVSRQGFEATIDASR